MMEEINFDVFFERLPFLVNGTLSPVEQRAMHVFFSKNPELLEDLRWHQGMLSYAQEHGEALKIEPRVISPAEPTPQKDIYTWMGQFKSWIESWGASKPSWLFGQSAAVFASGVFVAVLASNVLWPWVQQHQAHGEFAEFRTVQEKNGTEKACFMVEFKESSSLEQLNQFLFNHYLSIYEGPIGGSEYMLTTGRMNQSKTEEALKASDFVKNWRSIHEHDSIACLSSAKK